MGTGRKLGSQELGIYLLVPIVLSYTKKKFFLKVRYD